MSKQNRTIDKIKTTSTVQNFVPDTSAQSSPKHRADASATPPKAIPIPKGMPSITDNHKQTKKADKLPFRASFLLPKYWGIWLLFAIVLPIIYLPLRWQFWLGRKLGILVYGVAKSRRHVTLVNLRLAFPEKMEEERIRMAKQVFVNQGIGVFETLCAWFRPNLFTRTVSISGLQHLVKAQNEGRAVILLGGHYTMLDLGGRLCTQFFPMDCVYRPQNNHLIEWFVFNARRHIYDTQIDSKNMRQLISSIKHGKIIWYTPDQDFGLKHGVMSPFFGVPAATITAQRRLASIKTHGVQPAIMGIHFYRQTPDHLSRGKRPHYHITITPEIADYPTDDEVADATRINEILESQIRIDPTQWMWFHKRYKHNETGRSRYYD